MAFLTCNEHQIYYDWKLKSTDSSTMLLIHSLGSNSLIWQPVMERLQTQYNILSLDLRGHGSSEKPNGQCQIKDYASDVMILMDYLKLDGVSAIGLSLGGLIVQYLAIYYASRIDKLIVSNSAPKIGDSTMWNTRIKSLEELEISDLLDGTVSRSFSQSFQATGADIADFKKMFLSTSKEGYLRACEALRDEDLRTETKKINTPTLFIGGEFDQSITPEYLTNHARYIKNSKVYIIPKVGHLPCYESPDKFVEVVNQFIEDNPS